MLTNQSWAIILGPIFILLVSCSFASVAESQPSGNDRPPILLIHGYAQDQSVWNTWLNWLDRDSLSNIYPITFQNGDRCGSVLQHSAELSGIVDKILSETGQEQVNIVAHSKGGLDARAFLATGTDKVANLIMIGTPNNGSPASFWDVPLLSGCPLGSATDLFPWSAATQVKDHPENTNYYTIAGNWNPDVWCLSPIGVVPDGGSCIIPGEDDGLVGVESVESSISYTPLGEDVPFNHLDLLNQRDVYEMALPVLQR
jgi:pimeloyl-ACP methyl ester carboxylesterase